MEKIIDACDLKRKTKYKTYGEENQKKKALYPKRILKTQIDSKDQSDGSVINVYKGGFGHCMPWMVYQILSNSTILVLKS